MNSRIREKSLGNSAKRMPWASKSSLRSSTMSLRTMRPLHGLASSFMRERILDILSTFLGDPATPAKR